MKILLAVFVVSLSGVLGQQLIPGAGCPTVTYEHNFVLQSFLGKWYEVQRYDISGEELADCMTSNFNPVAKSIHSMTIDNEITWLDNWTRVTGNATATYVNQVIPYVGRFNLEIEGQTGILSYTVVMTDYTGYAIVWGCQPAVKPGYRAEYAWVLSRSPALSDPDRVVVDTYINGDASAIVPFFLRPVRQDNACTTPPLCKCEQKRGASF